MRTGDAVLTPATQLSGRFARSLGRAAEHDQPFRHWLLRDILPRSLCEAVAALPIRPPQIRDTLGRRETHNSTRVFFSTENRHRFDVCRKLADFFQSSAAVAALQEFCGVALRGSSLRIEYCQDKDGFWLEPHTDIGAKLFTMLVYLSPESVREDWGTDLYDSQRSWVGTAPSSFNRGLLFLPSTDTWHGFRRRPILGVRRSLIINYVKPEWRARHELACPEDPVA